MTALNLHEWLLSFVVNKITGMDLVKWMWFLQLRVLFAFEINQRKTPAPTDHSNGFQQLLVTGLTTLKSTINLSS